MSSSSWFLSPNGRKFAKGAAVVVSCGLFSAQFFPHTILLEHYYKLVAMRRLDEPVPLTSHLQKLWNQVLDDLDVSPFHRTILRPFMVFGYEPWHAGSLRSRFGAMIGIPTNFVYDNVSSIDKDAIVVNNEPVEWFRPDAKQLLESLVLSDDAKKYAIGREIIMTDNKFIYTEAIAVTGIAAAYYASTFKANEILGLLKKPRSLRFFVYSVIGAFYWGLWAMQRDVLTRHFEYVSDKKLSELNENYVKGGLEFYSKTLQRNMALRSLLGDKGNKVYTLKGNESSFFREKHIPNTQRKYFFEDLCKKLESNVENL
ncbi:transmembrane protein 177 [Microplitis mediator]|uniref:transmembrane protein 177 n=1 Tax=Microplitis mediator TaxID=375433 RepID=UPI0025522513|nr:transmembrane protein 177 [Microplitis mediator]